MTTDHSQELASLEQEKEKAEQKIREVDRQISHLTEEKAQHMAEISRILSKIAQLQRSN